jgi:hypothetical protein
MKTETFSSPTATLPPIAGSGTYRIAKKATTQAASRPRVAKEAQPSLSAFVSAEIGPVDSPIWPHDSALWLQGERAPSLPSWTGMTIERHNRIPGPGFLHTEVAPGDRPMGCENSLNPLRLSVPFELPESGLTPVGRDPRVVCRKDGSE